MTSDDKFDDEYDEDEAIMIRQDSEHFQKIYNLNNLMSSFYKVKKSSYYKDSTRLFYWYSFRYCLEISNALRSGTYKPDSVSIYNILERGKQRTIKVNTVRDKVVNTVINNNILNDSTYPYLIYDNGASRVGMGVAHSRRRLEKHLHDAMINFGEDAYILVCDLTNFFGSINIPILLSYYKTKIPDEKIYNLLRDLLIYHNDGDIGVGIGSVISQNAGIFYPYRFDNYIKIVLSRKYYGRYMDDFYIICKNKDECHEILDKITKYLESELGLKINTKKTQIRKLTLGFKYLKTYYRVSNTGKVFKRQDKDTFIRERRKVKKFRSVGMTNNEITKSYLSWRGNVYKSETNYPRIRRTDELLDEIYPDIKIFDTLKSRKVFIDKVK